MEKDLFFSATRRAEKPHAVEGFGTVTIRALTLGQRAQLPERFKDDQAGAVAWIVVSGVDGLSEEDLPEVGQMDPQALEDLSSAILALSGLSEEATEEAKND